MAKEISFENQMKRLTEIVEKLESEEVDLDESLKLYEEGLNLSKELKLKLTEYEKKIAELNKKDE